MKTNHDLKILPLVSKIGRVLAIVPKLKNNRFQKIYAITYFTILTIGVSLTYIWRKPFYQKFNLLKLLIKISLDLTCYFFNFYTTIVITCFKEQEWSLLLHNLRKTNCTTSTKTPYLRSFLAINFLFWILTVYTAWVWLTVVGIEYSREYILDAVQLYPVIFYNYLIYIILNMFVVRLQFLCQNLNKKIDLEKTRIKILILKDSLDGFNKIFGWPLLFIIMYSYLRILIYLDLTFKKGLKSLKIEALIDNILIIILFFVGTLHFRFFFK